MELFDIREFDALLRCRVRHLAQDGIPALGAVYELVGARIVRYARAIVRRSDDAEDVLQATLLQLLKYPESIVRVEHPWAYLLKIARHQAYESLKNRHRCIVPESMKTPELNIPDMHWQVDLQDAVSVALEHLPGDQREVIVLKI